MTSSTGQAVTNKRTHQYRVDYFSENGIKLFRWVGRATSEADAESQGLGHYGTVLKALGQAQGLPASSRFVESEVAASDPVRTTSPDDWRLGWLPPTEVERHPGASLEKLPLEIIQQLASSAALSDPVALEAMSNQESMAMGLWVTATPGGMRDIGTCLLINRSGRQVQHRWSKPALADALRLVTLRTSLPFRPRGGGNRIPYAGPRVEVLTPQSATIRTLLVNRPPQAPHHLIDWLDAEGYVLAAARLRSEFKLTKGVA